MSQQNDFDKFDPKYDEELNLKLGQVERHHHSHSSHQNEKNSENKGRKIVIGILSAFLILVILSVIAVAATFFVLKNNGDKQLHNYKNVSISTIDNAHSSDNGKTVTYNGKKYKFNENIATFAFLGVDKEELVDVQDFSGKAGQADTIILLTLDTENGSAKMISVPRDTIAEVDTYSYDGSFVGTKKMQLCLSYSYGDGKKTSCENTITAVSRLLYGIPINSYAALDINGIPILNDAVGGVTVTSIETIEQFVTGQTYNLKGQQAISYIQARTHDQNGAYNRVQRQMQYISAFTKQAVNKTVSDFGTVKKLYNTAMPYAYTNVTLSQATYLATSMISKGVTGFSQTMTIPGESKMDDKNVFVEYIVDDTALYEMILNIYYTQIN